MGKPKYLKVFGSKYIKGPTYNTKHRPNKQQTILKWQSEMDNPEKQANRNNVNEK